MPRTSLRRHGVAKRRGRCSALVDVSSSAPVMRAANTSAKLNTRPLNIFRSLLACGPWNLEDEECQVPGLGGCMGTQKASLELQKRLSTKEGTMRHADTGFEPKPIGKGPSTAAFLFQALR